MSEACANMEQKAAQEADKDKKAMYAKIIAKVKELMAKENASASELLAEANEMLSVWLDKLKGKSVTDNSIFATLPRHFECDFHKDMASLNVIIIIVLLCVCCS